jgi:isopropylmalate/homocitrate/citramalate synthase
MSGRKYIGTIVFNQNIDQYSKSKKESLKSEIYEKMVGNEYFIKNIELGGGHFLSHKNKTIKLKGDKANVEFKETVSLYNDTYKKQSKNKSLFNWAQKNFKRSMNFNKKMFLDDSLKAVKISVKKDNKTKKKTRNK